MRPKSGAILLSFGLLAAASSWTTASMAQDSSPNQSSKECRRDITAATRYLKSTSCYAVVLFCNECVHGENGVLEKQTSKPCGVCFGFRF